MDLSSAISYTDAAPQLAETLSRVHITKHDPAIILDWNVEALQGFVTRAIAIDGAPGSPARPHWLRAWPPTIASLMEDIVTYLAQVAGGRFGIIMLAPNTMVEALNIRDRITFIEVDPFMQASFAAAPPDQRLARTGVLVDNRRALQPLEGERPATSCPSSAITSDVRMMNCRICSVHYERPDTAVVLNHSVRGQHNNPESTTCDLRKIRHNVLHQRGDGGRPCPKFAGGPGAPPMVDCPRYKLLQCLQIPIQDDRWIVFSNMDVR